MIKAMNSANRIAQFCKLLAAVICISILSSCGDDSSSSSSPRNKREQAMYNRGRTEGFAKGVKEGAKEAAKQLRDAANVTKNNLRRGMSKKFIWIAIVVVFGTLFGPSITEWVREKVKFRFKIPDQLEVPILMMPYSFAVTLALIWSLKYHSFMENISILIILAGTIPAFIGYIKAVKEKDKNIRKLGLSKLKTLFFIILVICLFYHIIKGEISVLL